MERYIHTIGVGDQRALVILVNASYFSEENGRVPVFTKNAANRRPDLAGREYRSRNLVEERLKQVVIGAVDEKDARGRVLQRLGGCQAAESATDDHDNRELLAHI